MSDTKAEIHSILASINAAWREGHPSAMREYLDPEIAIVPPDFRETLRGREILVASFEEFCTNAKVLEYEETDEHIDVVNDCAVATFRFRMRYERAAYREDCSGRDLWVFARHEGRWMAACRAMMELKAERSPMESPLAVAAA
ncbi:MAG TPA: nuclear transport factor 2 family protein [Terracidiphilus sp.]|nr:nuclear transport factor 2 family protein [Terracidiphilus sp.]